MSDRAALAMHLEAGIAVLPTQAIRFQPSRKVAVPAAITICTAVQAQHAVSLVFITAIYHINFLHKSGHFLCHNLVDSKVICSLSVACMIRSDRCQVLEVRDLSFACH